jgi:hypothetical protein
MSTLRMKHDGGANRKGFMHARTGRQADYHRHHRCDQMDHVLAIEKWIFQYQRVSRGQLKHQEAA